MYSPTQAYTPGQNLDSTRALLIGMKQKGTLQSYVAQHKNSPEYPYLLALASSINQISDATKAAQHQPAPQTVADQKLGSLAPAPQLPEDVGIGQLPAQNMENFADGGIVAFGDGGEVPRFQYGGVPQTLPGGLGIYSQGSFGPQPGEAELQARIARIEANPRMRREDKDVLVAQAKAEFGMPKAAGTSAPVAAPVVATSAQTTTSPAPTPTAGPTPETTQKTSSAAPTTTPAAGLPSIDAYMKRFEMGLPKKEEAQSEESFMSKREEPMKEYFAKANQAIEKERGRLEEGKQQDFYMALIEGGLAAAGGTSQYGLQNLAQGFGKGAASFREALKDFRRASQENSKMEMDLMKAKAADKKGDMDAYQKHMDNVADRNAKIDGYKAAGLSSLLGHKISADATITAAGMPSGTERLIGRIGSDPNFASAYEKYASMGPNAKLPNQILAKYASDPMQMAKLKALDPDMYAQIKSQIDITPGLGGMPMPQVQNTVGSRP